VSHFNKLGLYVYYRTEGIRVRC